MLSISSRKRKDGVRYTAQLRIWKDGKVVHTESETFRKKSLAIAWGHRREEELKAFKGKIGEDAKYKGLKVGQVLEWYRDDFDGETKFGRSKLSHINFLIDYEGLSKLDALNLSTSEIVEHVNERRRGGAAPATVNNDIIWLRNAYRAVKIARNIPLDVQVIDDAAFVCRREGLIGKGDERSRRPSLKELNRLLSYFKDRDARSEIPMMDITLFALFSSRRQEEICRIEWPDLDDENKRVMVRKMKHPRKKTDTWVFFTDPAWKIIERQDKVDDKIFPFNSKSVSSAFTKACKFLEIDDLHFHDLRHECTSWLFELGWDIPRVANVTGHKSWTSLQRYTHIRELGIKDKYKDWVWLP